MKKIIFIILVAILLLNACASPPTATPPSTLTPLPPTQTPLPPTPDLDDILFSEVSEKYTLVRDNNERFHLQDEDENEIPEISIDIKGNVFFGEEDMSVTLVLVEDGSLTLTTKDDETLILNGEKWVEIIKNLPEDLPEGYIYNNPNEDRENLIGATITDAQGKPLYKYVEARNGEWARDFELFPDIDKYYENFIPLELLQNGDYRRWAELLVKPEDFNLEKMISVIDIQNRSMGMIQKPKSEGNFNDLETAFFKRDITFGYTEFITKEGVASPFELGMKLPYIIMPTWNYYEGKTWLEINLHPLYGIDNGEVYNFDTDQIKNHIDIWQNKMNVTAPRPNAFIPFARDENKNYVDFNDPFIAETFNNPELNMEERVNRFKHDDLSAFSGSDEIGEIFLITVIADHPNFR